MGNQSGKPPLSSNLRPIKNSTYGTNLMTDQDNKRIYQILDIQQSSIENFTTLMNARKEFRHPALITLNRSWVEEYRQECSLQKMYRVTLQYAYIARSLQDQITKYCQKRMPVPQPLIRKYFGDIVSCLQYLKTMGTCHGDIKPTTILINHDGRAFLADSYFIHGGKVSFQIVMQDPESLSLLSPAQLKSLREKKFISLAKVHEDEIFAIGLSMMETMTAEPAMQCYDLMNLKLKPEYFNKKFNEMISCGYSPQLCQLVLSCVVNEEEKRISFYNFLKAINASGMTSSGPGGR